MKARIRPNVDTSYQMYILGALAISFVIFGHIKYQIWDMTEIGTFYGWFPYYSFHLPIFLFISGYFFKDFSTKPSYGKSLGKFLLRKVKTLLLPYFVINGLFLLLGTILRGAGVTFCQTFSIYNWLILPWKEPFLISWSVPTWYLVALFIAEVYYVVLRKLFSLFLKKELVREIVLLAATLALGIAAAWIQESIQPSAVSVVYLRSLAMLFFIQVGYFYHHFLEEHDTLGTVPYIAIVFAIQFIIIIVSHNNMLNPGLFALEDFGYTGDTFFPCGLTGIALWLRISRLIAMIPGRNKLLVFIGKNTLYIMSFHVFGFFVLNWIFSLLYNAGIGMEFLGEFNVKLFKGYLYYALINNPRMILLYFFAGMFFSLLIALIIQAVKKFFHRKKIVA